MPVVTLCSGRAFSVLSLFDGDPAHGSYVLAGSIKKKEQRTCRPLFSFLLSSLYMLMTIRKEWTTGKSFFSFVPGGKFINPPAGTKEEKDKTRPFSFLFHEGSAIKKEVKEKYQPSL